MSADGREVLAEGQGCLCLQDLDGWMSLGAWQHNMGTCFLSPKSALWANCSLGSVSWDSTRSDRSTARSSHAAFSQSFMPCVSTMHRRGLCILLSWGFLLLQTHSLLQRMMMMKMIPPQRRKRRITPSRTVRVGWVCTWVGVKGSQACM